MTSADLRQMLKRHVPASSLPLIAKMKFFIEPEISCSRFFAEACFTEESLGTYKKKSDPICLERSELGEYLVKQLQDGLFIDIPCGLSSVREVGRDCDLVPLAKSLGASQYIEVDLTADVVSDRIPATMDVIENGIYQLAQKISNIGVRKENEFPVMTMQDDLLGFISKLSDARERPPLTLYLSGLQPDANFCKKIEHQREIIVPYLTALYDELDRICGPKDLLILNSAQMLVTGIDETVFPDIHPSIALFQSGFTLKRRCRYDKVHVYMKDSKST